MLRRHARGRVPVLQLGRLVEREPRADQIPRIARQPLPGQGGSSARSSRQPHRYEPSRACIRYGDSHPAASARAQQFAFTPGASPATYANAVPALRRCARTRPSTALTCASTLSAYPDTSPMLAFAAVSSLSLVTHQATRHGRPGFHPCNSGTPVIAITQRDPQRQSSRSPQHPDRRFL